MPLDDLCEGLAVDGTPVERRGDELLVGDRIVGSVDVRRIEWSLPRDTVLDARVRIERQLFDARSAVLRRTLRPLGAASAPAAWLDLRRAENPRLRELAQQLPALEGARVLELGGSGEVTRGFLRAGVRRIDQLDVSPGMQRLARARIGEEEGRRVVQHTTAAEHLPFASGTFDLAYSRHSLHHMDRSRVVPEVARVLKPQGALLLIEPYLPSVFSGLMILRRHLARVERGTDDPLRARDLALLRECFGHVEIRAEPLLTTLVWAWPTLARALRRRGVEGRLPARAVHLLGGRIHVLASR